MNEYIIVHADAANPLSEKVNKMIGEGWKPQGGVTVTQIDFGPGVGLGIVWAQAMIR